MQLHLHIDCCSWKANSFWRPDDTQYFCADIRLGIVSINNSFLLYGNEGETCEATAQCEFEEEERGKWEWQAEREVVNSARQYPILRKIERTTHSKQDGIQSNTLNGSALGLTKIWTNKRIGPLTNILYKESIMMELFKTWTNKRIEPLSWLDCTTSSTSFPAQLSIFEKLPTRDVMVTQLQQSRALQTTAWLGWAGPRSRPMFPALSWQKM